MQSIPILIIGKSGENYSVSIIGRFGGGFSDSVFSLDELRSRYSYFRSFDCSEAGAMEIIAPPELREEMKILFPKSSIAL